MLWDYNTITWLHLNSEINSVSLTRRLLSRDLTRHHTSSIIVSKMHSAHHLNNLKKRRIAPFIVDDRKTASRMSATAVQGSSTTPPSHPAALLPFSSILSTNLTSCDQRNVLSSLVGSACRHILRHLGDHQLQLQRLLLHHACALGGQPGLD